MPRPPAPAPSLAERLQVAAGRPRTRWLAAALLLGFFALAGAVAARTDTPTVDEFVYVPTGYYHLRTGDLGYDPTNPPLAKLAMALPLLAMDLRLDTDPYWRGSFHGWGQWVFGRRFMEANPERYLDAFFAARLVVLAIGIAGGALVFARARALASPAGALAALALYCTTPAILAHASLATLDVAVSVLVFAGFCALERFARARSLAWAGATGALFGLAFATKGIAAVFAPLVPLLAALGWGPRDRAAWLRLAQGLALAALCAWLALLAVYGFRGFPLPQPLLAGLRFQAAASRAGDIPSFLYGQWSQSGWWYYYLVALFYKSPLPSLALWLVGLAALARRRFRAPGDPWIALPPLLLLYVLSFHYAKDYGVRYALPALPFLVLLAAQGVDALLRRGAAGIAAAALLLGWQLVGCALAAPRQLAWFNELGGGPDRARRVLLDSNLDWGQDLGRLKQFMDARGVPRICLGYFGHVDPHLYGIDFALAPTRPEPGLCAVSANFLAGYPYAITWAGPEIRGAAAGQWSWFDALRPVARVGDSIYVFDVSEADVAALAARRP